ncbi:MAG: hypothetical protein HY815_25365 [Candidatus Riflebacteria bacterium]|nr:hypothetical protein [Candidatus Riflebacteria bacterium]
MALAKTLKFKSLDEARKFWDSHDSADYQDQMQDVEVEPAPPRSIPRKVAKSYSELLAALELVLRDAEESTLVGRKRVRTIGTTAYRKAQAAWRRATQAVDVSRDLKKAAGGRG